MIANVKPVFNQNFYVSKLCLFRLLDTLCRAVLIAMRAGSARIGWLREAECSLGNVGWAMDACWERRHWCDPSPLGGSNFKFADG